MTKGELLKRLKDVSDDQELFIVSSEYDKDDDAAWDHSSQSEISDVIIDEWDDDGEPEMDVYVVIECDTFD